MNKFNYEMGEEFNTGDADAHLQAQLSEASRLLLRDVTKADNSRSRNVLMINYVSRAFFETPMQRDLCIELPYEDRNEK